MFTLNSSNPVVIKQAKDGYRHSIEPFLLADFISLSTGCRILDVGTGCGIIPLLLTTRRAIEKIVAIEIQSSLYNLAVHNISMNGVADRVQLIHDDFISLKPSNGLFDFIISNPPFRKLNSGRINSNREKAIARHELSMDIESLMTGVNSFLKDGGTFTFAYPPTRLTELIDQLYIHRLFPARLRFIHGSREVRARILLIDAVRERQTDCVIEPSLYIYNENGSYSDEMEKIYASFNCASRTHHF